MTLLLLDGNNLCLRSFLAPKHDMSVDEVETGTLVLFASQLSRHMRNERPDRALIAWDGGASAYRLKMYPAYKASRKKRNSDDPQPPFDLIQKFLRLAGFPQLQLPGYEGDDVIYAVWKASRKKHQIIILSSDKDMMQLIEDGTVQIKFTSRDARVDRWDRARVIIELGYRPENIVYILALMGDKSDDNPGIDGIGPKKSVKLLKDNDWDMTRVVNALPLSDQYKVLRNIALIDLSLVPLELETPEPLDLVKPGHANWDQLEEFLDKYELKTIKSKLLADTLW